MERKVPEIIDFVFRIRTMRYPDGREQYQTRTENDGVSTDMIAMQLKAFLKILEDDYVEDFK